MINAVGRRGPSMRRLLASAVLLSPLVLVAPMSPAQANRADGSAWNREAAAKYLDQRMDIWFENGEKLQTGAARTTCVSCHTVIPYALARPALRRAMAVDQPTPQEARLADETSRRVQASDPKQLLFEADEGQSNGTEAVLYALILASADTAHGREPSDATRRAFARMWQMQRDDGAWDWLDVGLEPFESIESVYQGAAFAALAVGLAPTLSTGPAAGGVAKLRAYLRENHAGQNLHNRIWGLLASTSLPQLLPPSEVEALVGELQRRQEKDGGWSLNGLGGWRWNRTTAPFQSPGQRDQELVAQADGYATGLIVYTLRRTGVSAEHGTIKRGRQWLSAHQVPIRIGDHEWLAWRAYSLNYDREHGGARGAPWQRLFMSDAATAFATLGLLATD
jgi:squalene-hopene/tetraprenyl-beta-curcumene cyclase